MSDHRHVLSCDEVREAISAQLDDEPSGCEPASVEGHLADCPACRSWREHAHLINRRVRLAVARPSIGAPDLILSAIRAEQRGTRRRRRIGGGLRIGLALVAAGQLFVAAMLIGLVPAMIGQAGMAHMDHELVAFNAALALSFGLAAWRPTRARGMVAMAGIVAVALVAVATVDIVAGTVSLAHEAQHLPLVFGWLMLWTLARITGKPDVPSGAAIDMTQAAEHTEQPAPTTRQLRSVRPRPPAARHIPGKVAALVLLAGLIGILSLDTRPASAHAVLEQTSPANGSVVSVAPRTVSLKFGEPVTVESDSVRVFDDQLHRVDTGAPTGSGPQVGIALKSGLHPGTYTVTWRVVSADSHPVSGGFTFSIGHPSTVAGPVQTESGGSRLVGIVLGAARFAGYAGLVLGLGTALMLFLLWPAGRSQRRARQIVWTGWILLAAGTVVGLLLEGPYGAGRGIGHVFDGSLLAATFGARYGVVLSVRLALVLLLAGVLRAALRTPVTHHRLPAGYAGLGLAVVVTFGLAGHAATGSQVPLTMFSDVVHVSAMTCWLGGLALLVGCLVNRPAELRTVLPRFSRLAFTAVTVLVASGIYQSWRDVGSWAGFTDTAYGRLLLAKIGCVLLLVGLGNAARRWVGRHYLRPVAAVREQQPVGVGAGGPQPQPAATSGPAPGEPVPEEVVETTPPWAGELTTGDLGQLRRGLVCEVLIGVVVLVLTSILVNTRQAEESVAAAHPTTYRTSQTADQTRVELSATPARTGPVTFVLQVRRPSGAALPVQRVSASLSLPEAGIGPLPVTFASTSRATASETGPWRARSELARAGRWYLDVTVQTSPIEATAFRLAVPIH